MRRIWTLLRSRRLAAVLLVALTCYAWITTVVPLSSLGLERVQRWDAAHPALAAVAKVLGLHHAYSSPLFLLAVGLLFASTSACAWERSSLAWRKWTSLGVVTDPELRRLTLAPTASFDLGSSVDEDQALEIAESALRTAGMHTRRGPKLLEASQGVLGLFGSPLFHWMLALVFLFVALGQLTRHEGEIRVVLGSSVKDAADSYVPGAVSGGLFRTSYSGLDVGLTEIKDEFVVSGIDRGRTPRVEVRSRGTVKAAGWVYPNQPLEYGAITIHRGETDPALVGSLSTKSGDETQVILYYDFDTVAPRQFTFVDPGTDATVTVSVLPIKGGRVQVSRRVPSVSATTTVSPGQRVPITEGVSFTADSLTYYVTLRVVNDWSLRWIFGAFAVGIVGLALTVFVPPRVVRVMRVHENDSDEVAAARYSFRVTVDSPKSDPAFARHIVEILGEALQAAPQYQRKDVHV